MINNIFPTTLIVGQSGTGKSTSIENLNPGTTAILNIENKALPFKGAKNFEWHVGINQTDPLALITKMKGLLDPKFKTIETVVIEGFDKWSDNLLEYTTKETRNIKNRFEKYTMHNKYISTFFKLVQLYKENGKYLFIIGHDSVVETNSGDTFRALSVNGKQWAGKCEREVEICLFSSVERMDQTSNYYFETQSDGTTTAKSPKGMFETFRIQNDLNYILESIKKYYKD